jgi:hypothetical protein
LFKFHTFQGPFPSNIFELEQKRIQFSNQNLSFQVPISPFFLLGKSPEQISQLSGAFLSVFVCGKQSEWLLSVLTDTIYGLLEEIYPQIQVDCKASCPHCLKFWFKIFKKTFFLPTNSSENLLSLSESQNSTRRNSGSSEITPENNRKSLSQSASLEKNQNLTSANNNNPINSSNTNNTVFSSLKETGGFWFSLKEDLRRSSSVGSKDNKRSSSQENTFLQDKFTKFSLAEINQAIQKQKNTVICSNPLTCQAGDFPNKKEEKINIPIQEIFPDNSLLSIGVIDYKKNLKILKEVGKGSFAAVFLAQFLPMGTISEELKKPFEIESALEKIQIASVGNSIAIFCTGNSLSLRTSSFNLNSSLSSEMSTQLTEKNKNQNLSFSKDSNPLYSSPRPDEFADLTSLLKMTKDLVAVKQLIENPYDSTVDLFREFQRESSLFFMLKHPNVVELKGVSYDPLCLIFEWMNGGDLQSFLLHQNEDLEIDERNKIALDIAQGLFVILFFFFFFHCCFFIFIFFL